MRNTGPIKVTRLHPLFGAEVSGIDITRPLTQREFGPIRAAFEEHSVLLFRDQHMDDDKQIQFSDYFGPLETTGAANPAAGTKFQRQSNLDIMTGEPIPPDDMRMIYQKANYFWHSDSSFKRIPSLCSILTARVCPPEGGNTEFLCMRAAWDALPPAFKATVSTLVAEHALSHSRDRVQKGILSAKALAELPPVKQRLFRPGRLWHPQVGVAFGPGPALAGPRASVAAEAALAADERTARAGQQRLPGGRVDGHVLADHQRAGALVVDTGDGGDGARRPRHRQRPVELEGLLGVHQPGPVERAERAAGPGLRDQDAERGQHPLFDSARVLGGELELAQRISQTRPDRDRVEQRVRGRPRALVRLAG